MLIRPSTFIFLVIQWVGLNGIEIIKNKFLLFIIIAIYIVLFGVQILKKSKKYKFTAILYIFWLFREIINSSISVITIIWSKRITDNSGFGRVSIEGLDHSKTVIYSNSITITPGTIALEVDDQTILVHALDKNCLTDLDIEKMNKKICQLI